MILPLRDVILKSELVRTLFEKDELRMDNSMYTNWGCPVKGLLSHCLKLRPRDKGSLALDYGTAIHAGLEQLMLGKDLDTAIDVFIKVATELKIDKYLDSKRCTRSGIDTLAKWTLFRNQQAEQFTPVMLKDTIAVEIGIEKLLGTICYLGHDIKLIWQGKADAVVRYKGSLWLLDHKTASMMGDKFINDKVRSGQFKGYYFMLNRLVKEEYGEPLAGVLLNVICTGRKEVDFDVYELPYSDWQIEEWILETRMKLHSIVHLIYSIRNDENFFCPTETELCVTKYGNCDFFDVCNSLPKMRDSMLLNLYSEHNWHPHNDAKVLEG